jgi:tripartite-type tricarboxylate transporter receptor subunit TctC
MKTFASSLCVGISVLVLASGSLAQAQQFPVKPLRLIVPFAPGGPNDILGRLVAQKLTEQWGQQVLVENRGGAGGTIGLEAAARLPKDGYGIAMGGTSNLAVAPSLYEKLTYDPIKDFTPIINVALVPYALAVNPTVPAKSVKELVPIAAKKAGFLSYGSSGTGSMSSLAAELFNALAKTSILHVSGQIDMMFADLALIKPHATAGKLRAVAVTSAKRVVSSPEIPTIAESGLPGYDISPWFGVVAPEGIPRPVVTRLNTAIGASLKSPDVIQRLGTLGYEPIGGSPEQFAATIKSDIGKYAKIVKTAGIKADL